MTWFVMKTWPEIASENHAVGITPGGALDAHSSEKHVAQGFTEEHCAPLKEADFLACCVWLWNCSLSESFPQARHCPAVPRHVPSPVEWPGLEWSAFVICCGFTLRFFCG